MAGAKVPRSAVDNQDKKKELELIFVGDDWSEDHHDVCVLDEAGKVLARRRLPEGVAGVAGFHDLLGDFAEGPEEVAVAVVAEMNRQLEALEAELASHLDAHPDAEIIRSQPGLATVLGARVLGEFGDDPNRYKDARARKNYASTSPITVASGKRKSVKARWVGNDHLKDACYLWAFAALTASPGARAYYDALRARKIGHDAALRVVANRLVATLDCCLRRRVLYDEQTAWGHWKTAKAA